MLHRALLASTFGTWLLLQCPRAHADPAAAEALFREGRALLEQGQFSAACEKLEASNALESSAGTLLNLATCREKQGKTATAWANFVSAQRLAQSQNRPEQELEAERRASELEPLLSTLSLSVRDPVPGLEVRRAGRLVPPASFGMAVPIDPGTTAVDASAPGYDPVRLEVVIGASKDHRVLEVPKLRKIAEVDPASSGAASGDPQGVIGTESHANTSRVLPWTIGVVGGATLVAGGVLGALALSSNSKAITACDEPNNAAECSETQDRRDHQALASTVCVGVGLVGVGVAALWLLTGPSGRPTSAWSYQGEITRESALFQMRVGF
ncbi:MAG TPA: hypothetical protein VER11_03120 [Polyangiaceae bacterium]|nr:hypothetical protein [Polyangiaceae bacterium]